VNLFVGERRGVSPPVQRSFSDWVLHRRAYAAPLATNLRFLTYALGTLFAPLRPEVRNCFMDPVLVTALVCVLCAAAVGAIYFVWTRKNTQPSQPVQSAPK
jgi:hypothetical protein